MSTNSFKFETLGEIYEDPKGKPTSVATNNTRARRTFIERKEYREKVFPDGTIPNMVDTWGKDSFYGILNTRGNAILPNDTFLKPLRYSREGESLYALNFVADAFRDFAEKMRDLADNNIIHKDSPWAKPTAQKAMVFGGNAYNEYVLENMFPVFREIYLPFKQRGAKIKNMENFLEQFSNFQKHILNQAGPLTFSGFMESAYSSVLMSGLVIEIGKDKYDQDQVKSEKYGDINFQMAAKIAAQYGFSIDRNIPWRLVANIGSPALQEYMHGVDIENVPVDNKNLEKCEVAILTGAPRYPDFFGFSKIPEYEGVIRHINTYFSDNELQPGYQSLKNIDLMTDLEEIFKTVYDGMYIETWQLDMEFMKAYLLEFYNAFVRGAPQTTTYDVLENCPSKKIKVWNRSELDEGIFEPGGEYGDLWSLKSFYTIRTAERHRTKDVVSAAADIRRIINIYDYTRTPSGRYQSALKYAQETFIGPYLIEPLTYTTVADILKKNGQEDDISDPGRQIRVRRNLY